MNSFMKIPHMTFIPDTNIAPHLLKFLDNSKHGRSININIPTSSHSLLVTIKVRPRVDVIERRESRNRRVRDINRKNVMITNLIRNDINPGSVIGLEKLIIRKVPINLR